MLRLRSANLVNCIVIFLDGQSAFCRPPALAVVASLRRLPGVLEHSILAIHTLLSGLRSRVAIFGSVHPPFKNEVGLPQGGSLSTALFVLLSLPLYDALCDNGTACKLNLAEDVFNIPAAGYVDDIALLSADPVLAQIALDAAEQWAGGIRMTFNLGVDKSAVLMKANSADIGLMLHGNPLPRTDRYRHLGPSLLDLEHRVLRKTGTFVGWARSNEVPASVLGKLWCLYIEPLSSGFFL